jgi:single-strand DNA-binding protein
MQTLIIAGNLGKDAELRNLPNGDEQVANFSVAVDNGKDKQGNRRDSTWFECAIWGKRGVGLAPYLKKGGKVTVSGRPTVRVYDGKAYLGVNVDQITLQGGNQQSGGNADHNAPDPNAGGYGGGGTGDLGGDDIPFACEWRI